jgi:hypothetical protein
MNASEMRQIPYLPRSRGPNSECLVPTNLAAGMQNALDRVERDYGDLDEFVCRELGYDSPEQMWTYLRAEQVDANALAFSQLDRTNIFVNGDQTGNGKGRVAASNLERAKRQGKIPIFITKDKTLFVSMLEDLGDIGRGGYRPFLTPAGLRGKNSLKLRDGRTLVTGSTTEQDAEMRRILKVVRETDQLPPEYDAIFTTYSQLQTVGGGKELFRRSFLAELAPRAVLVMDESHEAGGSINSAASKPNAARNRAEFARDLISSAAGVVALSATAVKDPAVLDLYARRSNARLAVPTLAALESTLRVGGVPLQQVITSQFASEGEMRRLERSMEGIRFASASVSVDRAAADRFAGVMYGIAQFDEEKRAAIREISRTLKKEAKEIAPDVATGEIGADSTNFTSLMHNVIDQCLLMQKVESAVQSAKAAVERGEKPVLALANTMESFIEEYANHNGIRTNQPIDATFNDLMERYLDRSRDISTKDYRGERQRRRLTDAELGPNAVAAYEAARAAIAESGLENLPVSPIDYLRFRLEQEGLRVGEITGRKSRIEYGRDGSQTYSKRSSNETSDRGKVTTIDRFNNGQLDAVILNRSGSTGINLHSSEKFQDQRQRHMIVLQPERDINLVMQIFGRVNRIGQVNKPKFSLLQADVPAEKRLGAILSRRMASLNANTTANRESDYTIQNVPDFFNEYGEQIATDLLEEDPDLNGDLCNALSATGSDSDYPVLRRLTGRLPMLPIERQEEIYARLETEYNDLIERLEATGSNQLKADTLDLDARPLARMEVSDRVSDIDSEFAAATYLDVVDAKAPSKALTQLEVVNNLRAQLNQKPVTTLAEHDSDACREQLHQQSLARAADLKQRVEAYRPIAHQGKTTPKALERADQNLDKTLSHVSAILREFPPGTRVQIMDEQGRNYHGIVGRIEERPNRGRKNPAAPSNWRAEIYVADNDVPVIPVPLSQINAKRDNSIALLPRSTTLLEQMDVQAAFDAVQADARQSRQIFTGNLLRAYAEFPQGRIVNYTDYRGEVKQGLLMPADFSIEQALEQRPVTFQTPQQVMAFLSQRDSSRPFVQTEGYGLMLSRQREREGGGLILTTPRNGKEGKKYYLDDNLLDLIGDDFYSVSERMEAVVPFEQAEAILSYLMEEREIPIQATAEDDRDLARQIVGIELPVMQEVPAEPEPAPVPVVSVPEVSATPDVIQSDLPLMASEPPAPESSVAELVPSTEPVQLPVASESEPGSKSVSLPELSVSEPVVSTPAQAPEPVAEILAAQYQQGGAAKNVAKLLAQAGLSAAVLQGDSFHLRAEEAPSGANIPLVLERHGDRLYLTHYLEANGDLVLDSEMVFQVRSTGHLILRETAVQNPLTGGELRGCDRGYAHRWSRNLLDQRWATALSEQWSAKQNQALSPVTPADTPPQRPEPVPERVPEPAADLEVLPAEVGEAIALLFGAPEPEPENPVFEDAIAPPSSEPELRQEGISSIEPEPESLVVEDAIAPSSPEPEPEPEPTQQDIAAPVLPLEPERGIAVVHDPTWDEPQSESEPEPEPAPSVTVDRVREWYVEARALGRDQGYLHRIQHVGSELQRGHDLSDKAMSAMERDRAAYQEQLPQARAVAQHAAMILRNVGQVQPEQGGVVFEGKTYRIEGNAERLQVTARQRGLVLLFQRDRPTIAQVQTRDVEAFARFAQVAQQQAEMRQAVMQPAAGFER